MPARNLPSAASSVDFFADEWGLIEHAADQQWTIQDGRLVMDLGGRALHFSSDASE